MSTIGEGTDDHGGDLTTYHAMPYDVVTSCQLDCDDNRLQVESVPGARALCHSDIPEAHVIYLAFELKFCESVSVRYKSAFPAFPRLVPTYAAVT